MQETKSFDRHLIRQIDDRRAQAELRFHLKQVANLASPGSLDQSLQTEIERLKVLNSLKR